jgi:cobalamin-independent synthase
MSITVSTLGFPRIGPRRELKSALERFWAQDKCAIAVSGCCESSRRELGAPTVFPKAVGQNASRVAPRLKLPRQRSRAN